MMDRVVVARTFGEKAACACYVRVVCEDSFRI